MEQLVGDVKRAILVMYAASYAPLWANASRSWASEYCFCEYIGSILAVGDTVTAPRNRRERPSSLQHQEYTSLAVLLEPLVKDDRQELLQWLWMKRTGRWSSSTSNLLLRFAARFGYGELMRTCVHVWGATDIAGAVSVAAEVGQASIVLLCHKEWFSEMDVDAAMLYAAYGNQESIMRMCHTWGATHVNAAMGAAAASGHATLVRICHDEWGAKDTPTAMAGAAQYGHETVVRMCHDDFGARDNTDLNFTMAHAAARGHEHLVRLCHDEWGATDVNRAMLSAAYGGHIAIVRLCLQWGAVQIREARRKANSRGHAHIVDLCDAWLAEKQQSST